MEKSERSLPETKQYVIDRIIDHRENDYEDHDYTKMDQTLYRVHWNGYTANGYLRTHGPPYSDDEIL